MSISSSPPATLLVVFSLILYLGRGDQLAKETHHCIDKDIQPATDGVLWGVFPCLETISFQEIVHGFPVVEHFIAILYHTVKTRRTSHDQEEPESRL